MSLSQSSRRLEFRGSSGRSWSGVSAICRAEAAVGTGGEEEGADIEREAVLRRRWEEIGEAGR